MESESFISDKDFEPIKPHEDTIRKGQKMMKKEPSGEADAMKLSQILSKHPFTEDVNKRISEGIEKRSEQIQAIKILWEIWRD